MMKKKISLLLGGSVLVVGLAVIVVELFSVLVRPISIEILIGGKEYPGIDIGFIGGFLLVVIGILVLASGWALSEETDS